MVLSGLHIRLQSVGQAENNRALFIAGWFGVIEKYCSGWKFTIVYEQAQPAEQAVGQNEWKYCN